LRLALLILALILTGCGPQKAIVSVTDVPGKEVSILDSSKHLPYPATPHQLYNSLPPTSGPHVLQTVATGVYREEIPEEIQVQALEYGHVLIQYAPGMPAAEVRLLEGIGRRYPRDVVVAPYGKLTSGIALTAWGRIEQLDRVESNQIVTFITALAGRYNHGWRR
jgi:hypothetical protein